MGIWQAIGDALGFGRSTVASAPLREAAGRTVDDDDEGWRRLSGDPTRDLTPMRQERMMDAAVWLWGATPLANRLVELPLVYLLAEGVRLTAKDEEAQAWLDAFWADAINVMDLKLPKKVRELALYGEQCWPAFTGLDGQVRLGYLDPKQIATVVTDPDNVEQTIGIVTKSNRRGVVRRFKVIINGPETVFSARTQAIRETFGDGECFYFTVNSLSNAARGRSDLMPLIDWLSAYDEAMFEELDRWMDSRAYLWDVTLAGASQDEVERRAKGISIPRRGGIRIHNEAEKWEAVAPSLNADDTGAASRLFRNHVLGGMTLPEHWYGGGGDVNRSTGDSMGEPTFKAFSFRQREVKHMLESVGGYVIRARCRATGAETMADDPAFRAVAVFPELTARDTTKYAAALVQVVTAAAAAIAQRLMTRRTAVTLIGAIAVQLGVEIDAEAELAEALGEAQASAEEDLFPDGDG